MNNNIPNENNEPRINPENNETSINIAAFNNRVPKEKEKKEYKDGKGLSAPLIIFFILLIGFVFFLPNIKSTLTAFLNRNEMKNITSGDLRCSLSKTTEKFNIDYNQNFKFKDNKIYSYTYLVQTKGTKNDEDELTKIYNSCDKLSSLVGNFNQINISCEYFNNQVLEKQKFNLENMDNETLKAAYSELGGQTPEFEEGDNIEEVQKEVQAAGYTCKKIG